MGALELLNPKAFAATIMYVILRLLLVEKMGFVNLLLNGVYCAGNVTSFNLLAGSIFSYDSLLSFLRFFLF